MKTKYFILTILILLSASIVSAETKTIESLYVGTWSSGYETMTILKGKTGMIIEADFYEAGKGTVPGYIANDVLFIDVTAFNKGVVAIVPAVIDNKGRLILGGSIYTKVK